MGSRIYIHIYIPPHVTLKIGNFLSRGKAAMLIITSILSCGNHFLCKMSGNDEKSDGYLVGTMFTQNWWISILGNRDGSSHRFLASFWGQVWLAAISLYGLLLLMAWWRGAWHESSVVSTFSLAKLDGFPPSCLPTITPWQASAVPCTFFFFLLRQHSSLALHLWDFFRPLLVSPVSVLCPFRVRWRASATLFFIPSCYSQFTGFYSAGIWHCSCPLLLPFWFASPTLSSDASNVPSHRCIRGNCSHLLSRTGIFPVLFALFFLTLTNTILQILSYQPHHARSNPFRLLTQFTDNKKMRVLKPWCSRHNVYTTTGGPFQNQTKHKLYSMRVKPPARPSTTTPPPGLENPPYRSTKSSPRRHLLVCLLELEVPNDTRADH